MEIIKQDGDYSVRKNDTGKYVIYHNEELLTTPEGTIYTTIYIELAEKLMSDWKEKGYNSNKSNNSVLSYHRLTMDAFAGNPKEANLEYFDSLEWEKEWTLQECPSCNPHLWMHWDVMFGNRDERIGKIKMWLSNCSEMQYAAILMVYLTYDSINLAYLMTVIVEHVPEENHKKAITDVFNFICNFKRPDFDILWNCFECYRFYYGIHYKELGMHLPD